MATSRSLGPQHASDARGGRLRSLPLSVVLIVTVVAPMVVTQRWPSAHRALRRWFALSWVHLRAGQLWRVLSSTFVQGGPGLVGGVLVLLLLLPIAEWRIGSRLTALAFFLGDWISSIVVLLGARIAAALGSGTAAHVLVHLDSGTSAACYACAGAFLARLHAGRLRRVLTTMLVADLAIEGVLTHMVAEIQHPIAVVVGVTVATLASRRAIAHAPAAL